MLQIPQCNPTEEHAQKLIELLSFMVLLHWMGMIKFCSVHIDDILVFSENVDDHIGHLHQVCSRLCEVGLKLHPQKCVLGCPEVPYLGYVISAEGILPNPAKILAVQEFPTPTNVRAVREFLSLASYYRRFVPDFAKEAGPLHMLTRANLPVRILSGGF